MTIPTPTATATTLPPIPTTPPPPPGPYRALATPSEEQQIRQLAAAAARNHRSLPPTHPARAASSALASLLRDLLSRGVPAQELATLFSPPVTHQAIRARAAEAHSSSDHATTTSQANHRSDPPHSASLVTSAPYRRVRVLPPPYPFPPAPLPTFSPAGQDTSQQFLDWLASPARTPGAAYADNNLIRLHLTPVSAAEKEILK
jgi:hypothetical protein